MVATAMATDVSILQLTEDIRLEKTAALRDALALRDVDSAEDVIPLAITRVAELLRAELIREGRDDLADDGHAVALMVASLSPARRSICLPQLRELATAMPKRALSELLESPSPHVRIGARLMSGWLGEIRPAAPHSSAPSGSEADILAVRDVSAADMTAAREPEMTAAREPEMTAAREPEMTMAREPDPPDEADRLVGDIVAADQTISLDAVRRAARLPSTQAMALLWLTLPRSAPATQQEIVRRLQEIDERALRLSVRLSLRGPGSDPYVAGLVALGALTEEPITPLVESLSDPSAEVRLAALRALEHRFSAEAIEAVGHRLRDPRPDVRRLAAAILGKSGDARAATWLVAAACDPDASVRREVSEAIRSMASHEVIDQVLRALTIPASEDAAREVLVQLGDAATDRLLALIPNAAPRTLEVIGDILKATGTGGRLAQFMCDADPDRRRQAADGLAAMGSHDALRRLITLLDDPVPDVRRRVVQLIGQIGDARVIETLALAGESDPDPDVKEAIDTTIRRLTHRSAEGRTP